MKFTIAVFTKGRSGKGKGLHDRDLLCWERDRCMLCAGCVPFCVPGALTVTETRLEIDASACRACGDCVRGCPTGALALRPRTGGGVCPEG